MLKKWLWHPKEFECLLYNRLMLKRTNRSKLVIPSWKVDELYSCISFKRKYKIEQPTEITIKYTGEITVFLDGIFNVIEDFKDKILLPAGSHELIITVYNPNGLPCILVDGDENSGFDGDWLTNCGTYEWLCAEWREEFDEMHNPNDYHLPLREKQPISMKKTSKGLLFDFGTEMMAMLSFELDEEKNVRINYGETEEEALDRENCELYEVIEGKKGSNITPCTRAFRYITIEENSVKNVIAIEEYRELKDFGYFRCDEIIMNKIYDMSYKTLVLNSREFFLDGIKRDRWVWSGDVYACLNYNYYTYFDPEITENSIVALFGKHRPVMHVNFIPDYSFFLILTLYEHYLYTGRKKFVEEMFEKAAWLMDFCLDDCDEEGWIIKTHPSVWVFIDWAEFDEKEKEGRIAFEQILMLQALRNCAEMAKLVGDTRRAKKYVDIFDRQYKKLFDEFWLDDDRCFTFSKINGEISKSQNVYAEIFALKYNLLDVEKKKAAIAKIIGGKYQSITTPYMKYHELDVIAKEGYVVEMVQRMRQYWGGLVKCGAECVWEEFIPDNEEYSIVADKMGKKFGLSHCHVWGAGPTALLPKYVAGVEPQEGGYQNGFVMKPVINALEKFEAVVPVSEDKKIYVKWNGKILVIIPEIDGLLSLAMYDEKIVLKGGKKYQFDLSAESGEINKKIGGSI